MKVRVRATLRPWQRRIGAALHGVDPGRQQSGSSMMKMMKKMMMKKMMMKEIMMMRMKKKKKKMMMMMMLEAPQGQTLRCETRTCRSPCSSRLPPCP